MMPSADAPIRVNSTLLTGVAYDAGESLLELEFWDGAIYRYSGVPSAIHQALLAADSKGSFFNQRIRLSFRYTRIRRPR